MKSEDNEEKKKEKCDLDNSNMTVDSSVLYIMFRIQYSQHLLHSLHTPSKKLNNNKRYCYFPKLRLKYILPCFEVEKVPVLSKCEYEYEYIRRKLGNEFKIDVRSVPC